jgi:SAM-dependent methyltransferase
VTFEEVQRDWTHLGQTDPLWAVYVAPGTRGGKWDEATFFATGRDEVAASLEHLTSLGITPATDLALDFGAGVGRLSSALADHFDKVIGVDVSAPMLEQARSRDTTGGRIDYVLNEATDLAFVASGTVDLTYSSLVLQHLPRDLAHGYLRELVRVLRPGGAAVIQVVSKPDNSPRGLVARFAPWPVIAWMQTRLLKYPAPMRMTAMPPAEVAETLKGTARVLDTVIDASYGSHWQCVRYYLVPA